VENILFKSATSLRTTPEGKNVLFQEFLNLSWDFDIFIFSSLWGFPPSWPMCYPHRIWRNVSKFQ